MKNVRPQLQGMRKSIVDMKNVIFLSIKLDVIHILHPLTKMMQDQSLLTSEFVTMCKVAKETMSVLFGDSIEVEMFYNDNTKELFPTTRKLLNELTEVEEEIVPFRQTRNDTVVQRNKFVYMTTYFPEDVMMLSKKLLQNSSIY